MRDDELSKYLYVVTDRDTIRAIDMIGCGVLCIRCVPCGRRRAIERRALPTGLNGEMDKIMALRLFCEECNSFLNERFIPSNRNDVREFTDSK